MPPLPTGSGLGSALGTVAAPLTDALSKVADAMKKVAESVRATLPVLDTLADKFKELGERFKIAFRDHIGIPLTDAIKAIGRGIKFALPSDVIDFFTAATAKWGVALKATGGALAAVTLATPVFAAAVGAVGVAMNRIVAKANPAVAEQFNLALNDTLAVIGQALTPVLQVVTQLLRLFGDAIASFSGTLGSALGDIFSALVPIFEVFAEVFARVMGFVAEALKFVAPLIRIVAEGIRTIFDWIGRAVKFLLGLIGIELGDGPIRRGASTGAAVRQASHGSIESVIQKAQASAFSLGTASGPNYAALTEQHTKDALGKLDGLADRLEGLPDRIGERIANALNPFGKGEHGMPTTGRMIADPIGASGDALRAARKMEEEEKMKIIPGFNAILGGVIRRTMHGGDGSGTVKAE